MNDGFANFIRALIWPVFPTHRDSRTRRYSRRRLSRLEPLEQRLMLSSAVSETPQRPVLNAESTLVLSYGTGTVSGEGDFLQNPPAWEFKEQGPHLTTQNVHGQQPLQSSTTGPYNASRSHIPIAYANWSPPFPGHNPNNIPPFFTIPSGSFAEIHPLVPVVSFPGGPTATIAFAFAESSVESNLGTVRYSGSANSYSRLEGNAYDHEVSVEEDPNGQLLAVTSEYEFIVFSGENSSSSSTSIDNLTVWVPETDIRSGMWLNHTYSVSVDAVGGSSSSDVSYLLQPYSQGSDSYFTVDVAVNEPVEAGSTISLAATAFARNAPGGDSQGFARASGVYQPYELKVLGGQISEDLQFVELAFTTNIAPKYFDPAQADAAGELRLFDSSLYWFTAGDFNDPVDTQLEVEEAYNNRALAITPEQFRNYDIIDLTDHPDFGEDQYAVRIPVADLAPPLHADDRLAFHLDSGEQRVNLDGSVEGHFDGDVFELPPTVNFSTARYDNFYEIRPDAVIDEINWTPDGGVEGHYSIRWIQPLSEPLDLDLFWSQDGVWSADDIRASTNTFETVAIPGQHYPFEFRPAKSGPGDLAPAIDIDARITDRNLIGFVDSPPHANIQHFEGELFENVETNNQQSLPVPDIAALDAFLERDSVRIVIYNLIHQYEIAENDLPYAADIDFYWSDSEVFNPSGQISLAYSTEKTETATGAYLSNAIESNNLTSPPAWAQYLIVVYDEANKIREFDETNNISVYRLPDYDVASFDWAWNEFAGGLDGMYLAEADSPIPVVPITFYWLTEPAFANFRAAGLESLTVDDLRTTHFPAAVRSSVETMPAPGLDDINLSGEEFFVPPIGPGPFYLAVVIDPNDSVPEQNEYDNIAFVELELSAPTYEVEIVPNDPVFRKELHEITVVLTSNNPVPLDGYGIRWSDPGPGESPSEPVVRVELGTEDVNGERTGIQLAPYQETPVLIGKFSRTWDWLDNSTAESAARNFIKIISDRGEVFDPNSDLYKSVATVTKQEARVLKSLGVAATFLWSILDVVDIAGAISEFHATNHMSITGINLSGRPEPVSAFSESATHVEQIELQVAPQHYLAYGASFASDSVASALMGKTIGLLAAAGAGSTAGPLAIPPLIAAATTAVSSGLGYYAGELLRDYAADPPDPAFTELVEPIPIDLSLNTEGFSNSVLRFLDLSMQHNAIKSAEGRARDKADGAKLADDYEWAAIQLAAASGFADQALEIEMQLKAFRAVFGFDQPFEFDSATIAQFVKDQGLPSDLRTTLLDLGFAPEDINDLEQQFANLTTEQSETPQVALGAVQQISVLITAQTAFEHLREAAAINVAADSGSFQEISTARLDEFAQTQATIESLIAADAEWSEVHLLVQEFRQELRDAVQQSNNFAAASEFLDFAYGVTLALGFELAPQIGSVTVNDGAAQRSNVRSLTIEFLDDVTLADGAIQVVAADGTNVDLTSVISQIEGRTRVVLTFSGAKVDSTGSLINGGYILTVFGDHIQNQAGLLLDANADLTAGGDLTYGFHRLAGDEDGDRIVGMSDLFTFRRAYLAKSTDSSFNSAFDFDNDGDTDTYDYLIFRRNYRKRLDP